MSTINGISFQDPRNLNLKGSTSQNLGVIRWDPSAGTGWSSSPFASDDYGLYINSSGNLVFSSLGVATVLSSGGGGGGVPSWETIYTNDAVFNIASGGWTIAGGSSSATDVLTLTADAGTSGDVIQITNSGTGNDIQGTSNTWKVTKAGVATVAGLSISGTSTALVSTGAAVWTLKDNDSAALGIGASGATTMLVFDTTDSAEKITATVRGFTVIGNSNTVSTLLVTNNSATTFGANADSSGIVVIRSTSATSGALLQLQSTEATMTTGFYFVARSVGVGNKFTIAAGGVTVIAGVAASNSLTVTAGDMSMSDGSLTMVDADNAATLSITNDTATSASVFVFAGAGVFTGSTTTSFMTITPSGLTTGTAVYIPVAGLTSGRGIHMVANALTSGIAFNVTSSATAITGAGRLFLSTHTGATGTSAILNEFISAANDETIILQVTGSSTLAAGSAFVVSVPSMTTGTGINVVGTGITTGKGITVTGLDALTSGIGLQVTSAATAITGAGRMLYVNHTGATGTSATLVEFASSANDETILFGLTANSLTTGKLLLASATGQTSGVLATITGGGANITTGIVLDIEMGAATAGTGLKVLTSGVFAGSNNVVFVSANSATTTTGVIAATATGLTSGSVLFLTGGGANMTSGGKVVEVAMGAATDGVGISILTSGVYAGAGVLQITANSATTGTIGVITANGLTTGHALSLTSSGVMTTTGDMLAIVASGATTSTGLVRLTAAALTTGVGMLMTLNALTTGSGLSIASSSTDSGTRGLVLLTQTGAGATGTSMIRMNQVVTSTNYRKIFTETNSGITLWWGNGTTGQGNLTGTAGDVLLNGGSNKPEYCTGTTNWTALV